MAINKNFVVKHGLEVNTDVFFVDADTKKVGIKTALPQYTLDVRGGIGVTDIYSVGITTVLTELNVGTGGTTLTALGGGFIGVGTASPSYLLDIRSPVSTGQTALYVQGDLRVTGDINVDDISFDDATVQNLEVTDTLIVGTSGGSGIATIGTLGVSGLTTTQYLQVTGVSTFTNGPVLIGLGTSTGTASQRLQVTGGAYVSGDVGIGTTNSGSADLAIVNTTNTAALSIGQNVDGTGENHLGLWYGGTRGTGGANVFTSNGNLRFDVDGAGGSGSQIEFGWGLNSNQTQMVVNSTAVGIGTTQPTSKLTVIGDVRISGVSTLGSVKISSGIVTATSGVVTYYGDGSFLTGNARNLTATIGIGTSLGPVGYGVSFIDFRGPGLSTVFYDNNTGIATVNIVGGGGGSASIGIGSTPGDAFAGIITTGNLWYNSNLGRLFIYYQDTDSAQWVDASPFNVGIITSLSTVSFNAGSATSPSMYFSGDQQTGFFSPGLGEFTIVSVGSSVLNVNPSGVRVTGVVTATDFDSLSDARYKENVNTVNSALLKVDQLRGVKFNWRESGLPSYGVIAQELEEVLPELVRGEDPKTVNYNGIIGVLIEAIKELKAEVEELKNAK